MVVNVGEGEVILEGRNDQDERRQKYDGKGGNTRTPRRFTQPFRARARTSQGQNSRQERISA